MELAIGPVVWVERDDRQGSRVTTMVSVWRWVSSRTVQLNRWCGRVSESQWVRTNAMEGLAYGTRGCDSTMGGLSRPRRSRVVGVGPGTVGARSFLFFEVMRSDRLDVPLDTEGGVDEAWWGQVVGAVTLGVRASR